MQQLGLHARNCTQESPDLLHYASNTEQFFLSVSVIVFQFRIVYLKSDTDYPLNFIKTTCIIFLPNEYLLNSSYFCENNLNIYIQWRNTRTIINFFLYYYYSETLFIIYFSLFSAIFNTKFIQNPIHILAIRKTLTFNRWFI